MSFFDTLASIFTSPAGRTAMQTVAAFIPIALPIVKSIAHITKNTTDDDVVSKTEAVFTQLGVPMDATTTAKGLDSALREAAAKAVKAQQPHVPDNIIQAAVQMAVAIHKQEEINAKAAETGKPVPVIAPK